MIAFQSYESFVRMGGYSIYVWPAFTMLFVLLFSNFMFMRSQLRRLMKQLLKRDERIINEKSA